MQDNEQTPSPAGAFGEDPAPPTASEELLLDLDGFEGPIDVLLQLARDQKVDITKLSILALAEQYLEFVREARRLRLELAADYLVMAAWLAYLKSRLLLPDLDEGGEEPSGAEMAAALKFQLQRLEAMQKAGARLIERPQLGREFFARGAPEKLRQITNVVYEVSLFDLLRAYGHSRERAQSGGLTIQQLDLFSIDEATHRLRALLGELPGWRTLVSFLPHDLRDSLVLRSAVASTLVASLEMCKSGQLEIRQDGTFGPIYLRGKRTEVSADAGREEDQT